MTANIRLAGTKDFPGEKLIGLSTMITTGPNFHDSIDIAREALGENVPQGSLFAYLFRRFGYPNWGSDPYKELASYLLTTAHPDMLLRITPYAGGDPSISFSFVVTHDAHKACRNWTSRKRDAHEMAFYDWAEKNDRVHSAAEAAANSVAPQGWPIPRELTGWQRVVPALRILGYKARRPHSSPEIEKLLIWLHKADADYEAEHPRPDIEWRSASISEWDEADPLKPFALAMTQTLEDLQKAVWIRDCPINIMGPLDDEDVVDDVDYAAAAGYPSGAIANQDPKGFAELQGLILSLAEHPKDAIARAAEILNSASPPSSKDAAQDKA